LRELNDDLSRVRSIFPKIDAQTADRLKALAARLVAGMDELQAGLSSLAESAAAANALIEAAKVLAPNRLGDLDTELVRQAARRLGELAHEAGQISDWLRDLLTDRIKEWVLLESIPRLATGLDEVTERVVRISESTQVLQSNLPAARERALNWLHHAAIVATLVLLWSALAQATLLRRGAQLSRTARCAGRSP
jgi:hypothetical protein